MKKHRDSQKRIIFEDAIYFVTAKTYHNYPYFRERIFCDLFVENLKLCRKMKGFLLYGWVLNYDHFHLLIQPSDEWDISKVMQFLKRNVSHNMNYVVGYTEGANNYSRLQYHGLLNNFRYQFKQKFPDGHDFPKFEWQKSYYDHYIRNDTEFDNFLDYIEYNPEKHGMPKDWAYSFINPAYEDMIDE
jgi:REP element-mobilizing transposase RayT